MKTLKQMLAEEQLFVPCVYDVLSAQAAKAAGFRAVLLSGGALSYSLLGRPDMAILNAEQVIRATQRVSAVGLPVIVDADDGYGESPVVVYEVVRRLVKAGAQAVTIDDTTGIRGFERYVDCMDHPEKPMFIQPVVPREVWLAKIRAAAKACEGSDCLVIARTEAYSALGWDEMCARCKQSRLAGAAMTLICDGMETQEDAVRVHEMDPGLKMWPDVHSVDGKPNVELEEIRALSFQLVTFHIFEKAALYGMVKNGEKASGKAGNARIWIENNT